MDAVARLYRIDDLVTLLNLSRTSVWRISKRPGFPSPRRLPGVESTPLWVAEEIHNWIRQTPTAASNEAVD